MNKEQFLKDIENHKVKILKDDGIYRHLHCSKGCYDQHFDIVTYPNHLVISGDMGTFVFSRTEDMFRFFRNDELSINLSYWDEKIQSESRWGGVKKFSYQSVRESIQELIDDACEGLESHYEKADQEEFETIEDFEAAFRTEVDEYFDLCDLDEYRFVSEVENFESQVIPDLELFNDWEWLTDKEYSPQYIWCCYAIVWAIQQYDECKVTDKAGI